MLFPDETLTNSSVFGVFIYKEDGKIVFANKRFCEILGFDSAEELINHSILEFLPENYIEKTRNYIQRRTVNKERFAAELELHYFKSKMGALILASVFAYTIEHEGESAGLVMVFDKTKEKAYEKLFLALSQINQLIIRSESEGEILKEIADILVFKVDYLACAVGYIDENKLFRQIYTKAKKEEHEKVLRSITIGVDESTSYGRGSVARAFCTKKVSLIPDISKLPETVYWHGYYKQLGVYSACSIPVLKKGKVEYIILIFESSPNAFSDEYLHLLEELQMDLSFALEKIENQKNMNVLNKAINQSHEWVVITDSNANILETNDAVSKISGYSKEELLGKNARIFKSGCHDLEFYKNLWKQITSGKSYSCRFVNKAKDGSIFYLNSIIMPIVQNSQVYRFVDLSRDVTKIVEYEKNLEFETRLYNTLFKIADLSLKSKNKDDFLGNLLDIFVNVAGFEAAFALKLENEKLSIIKEKGQSNLKECLKLAIDVFSNPSKEQLKCVSLIKKTLKYKKIYLKLNIAEDMSFPKSYNVNSFVLLPIIEGKNILGVIILPSRARNMINKEIYNLLNLASGQIKYFLDKLDQEKYSNIILKALELGFEAIIITDDNFKIIYAGGSALERYGYSKEELIGKHHSVFSSHTHSDEFSRRLYETLESAQPFSGIMEYKTKQGEIVSHYTTIIPYLEDGIITNYIGVSKDISRQDELINQVDKLLHYDPLTGLMNLASFKEAIERFVLRANSEFKIGAIAILNPIDFKNINGAFGFEFGNALLKEIAQRLRGSLRAYDVVSKLESDRFGLILKDFNLQEDVLVVAAKLLKEISKPYSIKSQQVSLSFNIGLSFFPQDGKTSQELLEKAQSSLFDAKAKGENQIGFFRKELEEKSLKKLKLKSDLEKAVLNKEFIAHYQPYVDKDKSIKGAEALMRWQKDGKIIPPMEFINYLEETAFIKEAESIIMDQALSFVSKLKGKGFKIPISINLSRESLNEKSLAQRISSMLNYNNLEGSDLKIEIVERIFMDNFDYIKNLIEELGNNGVYFSIDDFGTGYSSLSYLSRLKVEFLKIDISFVRQLHQKETKSIVNTITALSHLLGIKTVAEGVETLEQFEILKSMHCDYYQGYLFYKPMSKEEFIKILDGKTEIKAP